MPPSASRAAYTAMVTESSSQFQMDRSPLPSPRSAGLNQALASAMALAEKKKYNNNNNKKKKELLPSSPRRRYLHHSVREVEE